MSDEFSRLLAPAEGEDGGDRLADTTSRAPRRAALVGAALTLAALVSFVGVLWTGAARPGAAPAIADPAADPAPAASVAASPTVSPRPSPSATRAARAAISTLADPSWVQRIAARTGIPPRALAAYAGAALRMQTLHPGCGLGWNTLAGIGEVESGHGTIFGGAIGADGVARPRIIGIALDGTSSLAVPDTDGGALDGDTRWDRALGPMQFIPETWARDGRDGDGDGRADVDAIDDAALTAADYLCRAGGDLADPSGWIRAVDAYNPSIDYNHRVAAAADEYAALAG